MQEQHIDISFKARYFQLGNLDSKTSEIWFVCHGQGQLAANFLTRFECIVKPYRCIIASEGLSRYYVNGFTGKVGASWMTKEDRLTDIENYSTYLSKLYHLLTSGRNDLQITFLGFSQGTATICRWASLDDIKLDRLIVWGGYFPPDLDVDRIKDKFKKIETYIIYGDNDPLIRKNQLAAQKLVTDSLGLQPITKVFEGEHDLDDSILQELAG